MVLVRFNKWVLKNLHFVLKSNSTYFLINQILNARCLNKYSLEGKSN